MKLYKLARGNFYVENLPLNISDTPFWARTTSKHEGAYLVQGKKRVYDFIRKKRIQSVFRFSRKFLNSNSSFVTVCPKILDFLHFNICLPPLEVSRTKLDFWY